MYTLLIHQHAEDDLESLWVTDPTTAASIEVLLEEIQGDQTLLDALTIDDFGSNQTEDFNVRKWQHFWKRGKDLWRLKIWDLEKSNQRYRVIYAYDVKQHCYQVLAVVPRSFDYDPASPISKRIIEDYKDL